MIRSVANIHLDSFKKKKLLDFPFDINDQLKLYLKQLQCFQFDVADIDLSFKESQAQFSIFYKDLPKYAESTDLVMCDMFII